MTMMRGNVTTKKIVIGLGLVALIVILGLKVFFVAGPTKKVGQTPRRRKRLIKRPIRGKPKKRRKKRAR